MKSIFFQVDGKLKAEPEIPDYFSLFGLKKTFNINLQLLESAFEEYIFELHPDFFTNSSESQKFLSLKFSAILKQAKDEISNPFSRAILLCKLFYHSPSQENLAQPQDFLITMLEIREKLTNASVLVDQKDLVAKFRLQHKNLLQELTTDFELFATATNKADLFYGLTQKIGKLKYYKNIEEQIQDLP